MGKASFPKLMPKMLDNDVCMFPEFTRLRRDRGAVLGSPPGKALLKTLKPLLGRLYPIPTLTHTLYREYSKTGDRTLYERPYFERHRNLAAAVMGCLLSPSVELLDAVHDYLWAICEETTWMLPAHEHGGMDLFATETGFTLAETLFVLGKDLAAEVRERVEYEVRRRIIEPYLKSVGKKMSRSRTLSRENLTRIYVNPSDYPGWWWKMGHNNWNGVCNSSVGAVLLYLEKDARRLAKGLNEVLRGLEYFIGAAFEEDGASTEGVGYWQYGLINFVAFSELLRCRTGGRVDLLAHPKMPLIAEYPLKVHLGAERYYNYSDCAPKVRLQPGTTTRLVERTGASELSRLIHGMSRGAGRLPMALRDILWWDGSVKPSPRVTSALLPAAGIFRLKKGRVVVAGKAGHNSVPHNHNDIGSFIVHAAGEDLLCDPGRPTYCRDFFSARRYELFIRANSRGHSVPAVAGRLQEAGKEYSGSITEFNNAAVEMEFSRAYPVKQLKELARRLTLTSAGFTLEDTFMFKGIGRPVEEAFVTWLPVKIQGGTAAIRGEKSTLKLKIASPSKGRFSVEKIVLEDKRQGRRTLSRISVKLVASAKTEFRMTGEVKMKRSRR